MTIRIDAGAARARLSFSDDVRAGGNAMASAVMDAAGRLGQAALRLQAERRQEEERRQREEDAVYLARESANWRVQWAKDLDDGLNAYDGSQPGFAADYVKRYNDAAAKTVAAAPERVRPRLEAEFLRQGQVLWSAAHEGEGGRRDAFTLNSINATADTEAEGLVVRPDMLEDALAGLPALVDSAPASVRQKLGTDLKAKYGAAYAEGLLAQDPHRLVDELTAGRFDPLLSAESKAAWLKAANGAVERFETQQRIEGERYQRELEANARSLSARAVAYWNAGLSPPQWLMDQARDAAREAQLPGEWEAVELARWNATKGTKEDMKAAARGAMGAIEKALELGLTPGKEMIEEAAARVSVTNNADLQRQLVDMMALAGKQREFAFATPEQLAKRRTELRNAPATRESTNELELLESVIKARDKAIGDYNLAAWLASNGTKLTPLDASDPNLADAIFERARTMKVAAKQMNAPFQLFSKNEAVTFGRQLENMPADQRLSVLGVMAGALGPDSGAALREISKSAPADAQAGLLLSTGKVQAARDAAAGLELLKKNPKLAPVRGSEDVMAAESQVIGRALPPDLADERNAIVEAARAIYATDITRRGDADGEFDENAFKRALQTAAGGDGRAGGIGKVNGLELVLPPQLTADHVRDLLASGEVFGANWYRYSYGDPESGKPGGPPAWQDRDGNLHRFPADQLRNAQLVTRGSGLYWVKTGGEYLLDLDTGEPFILDLRRAEAPQHATSRYEQPGGYRGR